jgi:type IV pilus assembly protein PilO
MTNLQQTVDRDQELLQRRLLLGVPIGAGALVAALVFGVAVVPQWLKLRENSARIEQVRDLEQRLPLLRAQLDKTSQDQDKAEQRRQKILTLIQGSGEFHTFLAQLDREARRSGVQLQLFEPVVAALPPAEPSNQAGEEKPAAEGEAAKPKSPLEAAGLKSESVLLSAQGRYPNLLGFMRAVERLSLLVVPSDFAISLVEVPPPPGAPAPAANAPKPTVPQLKLKLTYYTPAPEGPAPANPSQPGQAPAAPAAEAPS